MINSKKEKLAKLSRKYFSSSVILFFTAILLFSGSNFLKGTWLTVLLVLYLVNTIAVALLFLSGIFLLFYLRKYDIERRKIRWGVYINLLAILIFLVLGSLATLN